MFEILRFTWPVLWNEAIISDKKVDERISVRTFFEGHHTNPFCLHKSEKYKKHDLLCTFPDNISLFATFYFSVITFRIVPTMIDQNIKHI